MQKLLLLLCALVFTLSGCSLFQVHKMDIEEGNVLTQEQINHLHRGMSQADVKNLLGTPMVLNTFRDNRMDYVYSMKTGQGKVSIQEVTLTFQRNKLVGISSNTYSEFNKN